MMTERELLEAVRRVEIRTNRLVNDMMVGAYLSHFKGRGLDFEELRDYIPGDDVRDIDWNVTYRMGRPFVRRFREERELGVMLAVDVSASAAFGSSRRSKREFAAEIAAATRSDSCFFPKRRSCTCPLAKAAAISFASSGKCSTSSRGSAAPTSPRPSLS
jgi:hypothetical protein